MTTDTMMANETPLNETSNTTKILLISCLLGLAMGIIFILIQPGFGMDSLTSRHAAAYQKLGNWGVTTSIAIAWTVHLAVSVLYGLLSGIVMLKTSKIWIITVFALVFTWLTTIIAPPANAMIVQLVSFQQIKPDALPVLNFSLDVKFVLHLIFFFGISAALYLYKKKTAFIK